MSCSCGHGKNCTQRNCLDIVPIFSGLTPDEMMEVAMITDHHTYQKGEMVYMVGDLGGKLYVLHTGRVKISRLNANGKEQVIRVINPGEFMGELSLFSSLPLTDNGEVLAETSMCIIDGSKLKELMQKYPSISFKIMDILSQRLEKAENLIENINLSTVEQRLAQALLELAGDKKEVRLNMTKGDFASQIGMSQETLSRKLSLFEEKGLIQQKGQRRILILRKDGLEDMMLSD